MDLIAIGAIAALTGTLIGAFGVGYLRERGRRLAARHGERRDAKRARREAERSRAEAEAARKRAEEQKLERLARLSDERLGVRFLRRAYPDDPGELLTVIEVPDERNVVIEAESLEGHVPTQGDFSGGRVRTEWRNLVRPPAEQQRRTGRFLAETGDEGDGWVEFERLDA